MAIKAMGICESCDKEDMVTVQYGNIKYCDSCWEREQRQTAMINAQPNPVTVNVTESHALPAPIAINSVLRDSAAIDSSVQVRTDVFNAKTKSIIELKEAIDKDDNIKNKPYTLAETLHARYTHLKTVVFELNQQLVDAGNEQKAIQVYMNTLSNQLRAEEREKLKISDINYKPAPPKVAKPKTVSTTGTKPAKIDKKFLRYNAAQLGVSEFTLQMIVVSKGCTILEAVEIMKKQVAEAKTAQTGA